MCSGSLCCRNQLARSARLRTPASRKRRARQKALPLRLTVIGVIAGQGLLPLRPRARASGVEAEVIAACRSPSRSRSSSRSQLANGTGITVTRS